MYRDTASLKVRFDEYMVTILMNVSGLIHWVKHRADITSVEQFGTPFLVLIKLWPYGALYFKVMAGMDHCLVC